MTKKSTGNALTAPREPKLHFVEHVIKGDTYKVLAQSSMEVEDEFGGLYYTQNDTGKALIAPPFSPKMLANMVYQNNILSQCVDAMEVNIDGTGFELVAADETKEMDKGEQAKAQSFFDEPYPQKSLASIRRAVRREMESIGYSYIEVLRNLAKEIVGLRHAKATQLRYVRLDAEVPVTKTVMREGKEVPITVMERERRFVQIVGNRQMRYFREYGATRELHVDTGEWESKDKPVPPEKRATELKVFGINPDTITPYHLPRWINQMPSVIGSRKAEENNLEFFDAGGIPPAIIFIQGGTLASDMSQQLRQYLSGQMTSRNRAVVVEAQANSGSLESTGTVQVKVERFGSERANDAMFMDYDKSTEEHVRTGFRLPPLFLGKAADFNFATAQVAYMVAEAQVFDPERSIFDEWVNRALLREMGIKTVKFKSKPITLKDVDAQIQAMTLVQQAATPESLVGEVNKIAGLTLEHQDPLKAQQDQFNQEVANHPAKLDMQRKEKQLEADFAPKPPPERVKVNDGQKVLEFPQGGKVRTHKSATELLGLVGSYMEAEGLDESDRLYSDTERADISKSVDGLVEGDREAFWKLVSLRSFGREDLIEVLSHEGCDHQP